VAQNTEPKLFDNRWYRLSIRETMHQLNTSHNGLSSQEARERLQKFGLNELGKEKKVSLWSLIADQFKSVLVIILIVAVDNFSRCLACSITTPGRRFT